MISVFIAVLAAMGSGLCVWFGWAAAENFVAVLKNRRVPRAAVEKPAEDPKR